MFLRRHALAEEYMFLHRHALATFGTQWVLCSCCACGLHSLSTSGLRVPAYGTYTPGRREVSFGRLSVHKMRE